MEVNDTLYYILTVSLSAGGSAINALTLTYFIRYKHKGVANHVTLVLGCLDMSLCLLFPVQIFTPEIVSVKLILITLITTVALSTNYVVLLLSVLRAVSVVFPFYAIRKPAVYCSLPATMTTLFCVAVWEGVNNASAQMIIYSIIFTLMATTICVSGTVTFIFLSKERLRTTIAPGTAIEAEHRHRQLRTKFRAAKTVLYLTLVFFLTNGVIVTNYSWTHFSGTEDQQVDRYTYLLFLVNSVANPVILAVRRSGMRDFIRAQSRRVTGLLTRQHVQ